MSIEPLQLQALSENEAKLKNKIKNLGDAPENTVVVARAKLHLSELQLEIKKYTQSAAVKSKSK